jgi:hypothetical protein
MKFNQYLACILALTMSCHSPASKPAPPPIQAEDTLLQAKDTPFATHPDPRPEHDSAVVLTTHLRDTTYAAGNFILFLRPDDDRYAELEKGDSDEIGDVSTDFGVGMSGTRDGVKKNNRYRGIKVLTTASRYICIKDCRGGPLIIDRDSVSFGFILSAKGRPIATTYDKVHSGNYLGELDDYFSLR